MYIVLERQLEWHATAHPEAETHFPIVDRVKPYLPLHQLKARLTDIESLPR